MSKETDMVNAYRLQRAIQAVELDQNHSAEALQKYYSLKEYSLENWTIQQFLDGKYILSFEELEQCVRDAIEASFEGSSEKLAQVAQRALDKTIESL